MDKIIKNKEDNRKEFLKNLELNVKDKKASLENYNKIVVNKNK
jgi:hypothetical protein